MIRLTTLTVATILLAAGAISAQACDIKLYQGTGKHSIGAKIPASMLARNNKNARLGAGIVGLWHVVHNDPDGNPLFESFEQWHSDGTEFEFANIPPPPGTFVWGRGNKMEVVPNSGTPDGRSMRTAAQAERSDRFEQGRKGRKFLRGTVRL
jgi:hypothetical protein